MRGRPAPAVGGSEPVALPLEGVGGQVDLARPVRRARPPSPAPTPWRARLRQRGRVAARPRPVRARCGATAAGVRRHTSAAIAVSTPSGPSSTNRVTPRARQRSARRRRSAPPPARAAPSTPAVPNSLVSQLTGQVRHDGTPPALEVDARRRPPRTRPASAPSAASGTRATPRSRATFASQPTPPAPRSASSAPETTTDVGPLTAATSTPSDDRSSAPRPRRRDRQHRPTGRQRLHQTDPAPPPPARVLQRQHARDVRRRDLADRMTRARSPASTPHDSSSRNSATSTANNAGCVHTVRSSTPSGIRRTSPPADRPPNNGVQRRTHLVQRRREHRERLRQTHGPSRPAAHPDPVNRNRRPTGGRSGTTHGRLAGRQRLQTRRSARPAPGRRRRPGAPAPARRRAERAADVHRRSSAGSASTPRSRSAWARSASARRAPSTGHGTATAGRAVAGLGAGVLGLGRRLLHDDVRVGAADPERGHAGPARAGPASGHGRASVSSSTAPAVQSTCGDGSSTCRVRGSTPCRIAMHHLDHTGDARRRPGCARCSTSPSRATAAGPRRGPGRRWPAAPAPRSGRRASCRCRAPRPRPRRRRQSRALASACRITRCWDGPFGAVSPFDAPSWLTADAADHREHLVAVAPGVGEPLQHQHADALGPAGAVGGGGERLAPAVGGQPALPAELDEAPGWPSR